MAKKKTTKKKTAAKSISPIRGKTFCITGKLQFSGKAPLTMLIQQKGGKVGSTVSADTDFLLVGQLGGSKSAAEEKAESLNECGKANIQIIDELAMHQMFAPTREASLKTLSRGVKTWNSWMEPDWLQFTVDLSEADFRKRKFVFAKFEKANVNGCDFRRANLGYAELGVVYNANFDGCDMDVERIGGLINCSARRIKGVTTFQHLDLSGTDFTGGRMWRGDHAIAVNCTFDKARFEAFWEYATFTGSTLVEAKFTKARMFGCDFTDCDLTMARFHQTDLTGVNFQNANLTGADFKGAILNDANFASAKLKDADFTEANVRGVSFTPSQIKAAKGLTKENLAGGEIGKYTKELLQVAGECDFLHVSIRVDLERHDYVVLHVAAYEGVSGSSESQFRKTYGTYSEQSHHFPSLSVSQSLVGLANRYVDSGSVQLDSIEVSVEGSAIKPEALAYLAKRAWCEAFSLPVPSDADLKQQQNEEAENATRMREAALADFRNGVKGVKSWNNRKPADREIIGSLNGLDFSNLNLKKINFDEADLHNANFAGAKLQDAIFMAANLSGVDFTKADVNRGNFFRADIRGANFTGAKLTTTDFDRAQFDEQTVFPKGFYFTKDMIWVGKKGADPRVRGKE